MTLLIIGPPFAASLHVSLSWDSLKLPIHQYRILPNVVMKQEVAMSQLPHSILYDTCTYKAAAYA